jgi:hypothetical protein
MMLLVVLWFYAPNKFHHFFLSLIVVCLIKICQAQLGRLHFLSSLPAMEIGPCKGEIMTNDVVHNIFFDGGFDCAVCLLVGGIVQTLKKSAKLTENCHLPCGERNVSLATKKKRYMDVCVALTLTWRIHPLY